MVVLDADRQVVGPAKLWNDTESAADAGWLVKQLAGGAGGVGGGGRQRAGGVVHDHQAVVAAPQGAGRVEAAGPRVAPARLADAPADGRARDRPRRRVGHRATGRRRPASTAAICWRSSTRDRDWTTVVPRVARPDRGRRRVGRRVGRGRHRRQHGRRARSGAAGRRRGGLDRHVGHRLHASPISRPPTRRARWRGSPTPPVATCRSCARSTRPR